MPAGKTMHNPRHHTTRRLPPLQNGDFDHEISLVDHSEPVADIQNPENETDSLSVPGPVAAESSAVGGAGSGDADEDQPIDYSSDGTGGVAEAQDGPSSEAAGPAVRIQEPTPQIEVGRTKPSKRSKKDKPKAPESAIDILYENQRGCILCGVPVFSARALGNLDPPPWTNYAHKPSPTDIYTAQVPDPSWEWAWPEWRVNHDTESGGVGVGSTGDDDDSGGWEYSFMFAKAFSWHKPHWWNSFVRRRAWIRMRVKKSADDAMAAEQDPHMLNPDYFTVRPSSEMRRQRTRSRSRSHSRSRSRPSTSHRGSKASIVSSGGATSTINQKVADTAEVDVTLIEDIDNIEDLLMELRASRIDREKIEAIENYLAHAGDDLAYLQEEMHEIMSLFVFQASRRVLLTRLTEMYDQTMAQTEREGEGREGNSAAKRRAEHLAGAIKHADEELRRLEYWSDVKGMVEEGESKDVAQGCDEGETVRKR